MTAFSPEHGRDCIRQAVDFILSNRLAESVRKAEIKALAWTLAQVYKKQKQPADWSAVRISPNL